MLAGVSDRRLACRKVFIADKNGGAKDEADTTTQPAPAKTFAQVVSDASRATQFDDDKEEEAANTPAKSRKQKTVRLKPIN